MREDSTMSRHRVWQTGLLESRGRHRTVRQEVAFSFALHQRRGKSRGGLRKEISALKKHIHIFQFHFETFLLKRGEKLMHRCKRKGRFVDKRISFLLFFCIKEYK